MCFALQLLASRGLLFTDGKPQVHPAVLGKVCPDHQLPEGKRVSHTHTPTPATATQKCPADGAKHLSLLLPSSHLAQNKSQMGFGGPWVPSVPAHH